MRIRSCRMQRHGNEQEFRFIGQHGLQLRLDRQHVFRQLGLVFLRLDRFWLFGFFKRRLHGFAQPFIERTIDRPASSSELRRS